MCYYVLMRTTVELPPELLRRAKAQAASRGESMKAWLTRAVAAETEKDTRTSVPRQRVTLPLFGDARGPAVGVTSADVARALANEDAARAAFPRKRR